MVKKSYLRQFAELWVIIVILLIILAKLFIRNESTTAFLFAYGLSVTTITWISMVIAFYYYKDPFVTAMKQRKQEDISIYPLVSCMVAVKNEEKHIQRCVESMINQTYKNKEIIVVNDASEDTTLDLLREYEQDGKIVLINLQNNVGKKRALAQAMSIAKGEIFAHTDSDSIWHPEAIEKITHIFMHDPLVGAVSGHGRALNWGTNILTKAQDAWMEGQFSIRKAFESVFGAVTCVSGPLAVFRKDAIFNFIPAWENDRFLGQEFKFATDRTLTGFVLGNTAVGSSLKKKYHVSHFVQSHDYPLKNWKVVYCKAAKSWTIVPDTFKRFLVQQIRWKKSFIRNIFFTGLFYWRKPLPVALVYYLHIIFVVMGPFVTFRHLVLLPSQGNVLAGPLYLAGIIFVGFMFGLAAKLEDPLNNRWTYRPIMSLLSTLMLSFLLFYSALTIRKMVWSRN